MLPSLITIKDLHDMLNERGPLALEFMDIGGISLIGELLSKLSKQYVHPFALLFTSFSIFRSCFVHSHLFCRAGYTDMVLALLQCLEVLIEVIT